jgi:hypothetical protein
LRNYVKNILGWPFFELKEDTSLTINIWRVRSFLQTLTGVGISIVEGAHRVLLTTKLMTGMNLNQEIPFYPKSHMRYIKIPTQSPTWSKANLQVLTVRKNQNGNEIKDDIIIKNDTLWIYQEYSQKVADQKTHFIDSTWKDWVGEVTRRIADDQEIDQQFDHEAFSKLKEPAQITEIDKYLDQHHKVMTHVATCLFDKLPASRLAESAKTYHEKDKSKVKQV